jgi:hypothetical protein
MKYRCKSRLLPTGPCKHNCVVESSFEPRACLLIPVYEIWEKEVGQENLSQSPTTQPGDEDVGGPHGDRPGGHAQPVRHMDVL